MDVLISICVYKILKIEILFILGNKIIMIIILYMNKTEQYIEKAKEVQTKKVYKTI
jgi:hypothetical protein